MILGISLFVISIVLFITISRYLDQEPGEKALFWNTDAGVLVANLAWVIILLLSLLMLWASDRMSFIICITISFFVFGFPFLMSLFPNIQSIIIQKLHAEIYARQIFYAYKKLKMQNPGEEEESFLKNVAYLFLSNRRLSEDKISTYINTLFSKPSGTNTIDIKSLASICIDLIVPRPPEPSDPKESMSRYNAIDKGIENEYKKAF